MAVSSKNSNNYIKLLKAFLFPSSSSSYYCLHHNVANSRQDFFPLFQYPADNTNQSFENEVWIYASNHFHNYEEAFIGTEYCASNSDLYMVQAEQKTHIFPTPIITFKCTQCLFPLPPLPWYAYKSFHTNRE